MKLISAALVGSVIGAAALSLSHARKDVVMPIIRVSRGKFPVADVEKVRTRLAAADAALAPELKKLRGMRHYWAGIDGVTGTMVNVSVWDSLADAKQMENLAAMQALAKEFIALGVEFERPIINYETVWEH